MNGKIKYALVVLSIAMLGFQSAFAETVSVTYTATMDRTATPWGVTTFPFSQPEEILQLPLFNPDDFPTWESLDAVCLQLDGVVDTEITITAINDVAVNTGTVGASIDADFSNGMTTLSLNVLPGGSYPAVNLFAGMTDGPRMISGTDTDSTELTTGFEDFVGAGVFDVIVSALGSSIFDTTGGNVDPLQLTDASAVVSVTYKGTAIVPEPSTGILGILAFAGITAMGRRRRRRN